MSQVYHKLSLLVLFSLRLVYGYPGDNIRSYSPYEMRAADRYMSQPYPAQYQTTRHKPQPLLHTDVIQKSVPTTEKPNNQTSTLSEFFEALNEASLRREEESQLLKTGPVGREDNPAYSAYPRPNYAPPATYHETPSVLAPSVPKIPLLKPDLSSLLPPVTTKVSSKINGLLGLVISLFTGSTPGGLEVNGLKDVLINGVIRPLLIAKGGIKALISKLSVPVISLLLINLEVLVTVWWLWEECPEKLEPVKVEPIYTKPAYNYNSYR